MSCPTCDHTMHQIGAGEVCAKYFWCPRCGTLKGMPSIYGMNDGEVSMPKLVERCREYEAKIIHADYVFIDTAVQAWRIKGIEESINVPASRPEGSERAR